MKCKKESHNKRNWTNWTYSLRKHGESGRCKSVDRGDFYPWSRRRVVKMRGRGKEWPTGTKYISTYRTRRSKRPGRQRERKPGVKCKRRDHKDQSEHRGRNWRWVQGKVDTTVGRWDLFKERFTPNLGTSRLKSC